MRIGMFTEAYHPTMNGVVVSIDTFAAELRARGHEVIVFAPANRHAPHEAGVVRIPALSLPTNQDYFLITASARRVTKIAQTARLDVIHSHHIFRMGSLALATARTLDIPIVQTYHTLLTEYGHYVPLFQGLVRWYLRWRSRTFLNRVNQVVTPSPSIAALLRSYGVRQPITSIPTGIDLAAFTRPASDAELRRYGIDPGRPFVLFVGRLAAEKNVQLLLNSFLRVHQVLPEVQLVLIGSGPARGQYESWVANNQLSENVAFTGFLPKDVTNRVFGRAAVFGFPSVTDTQGIVIQEAMAAGVPPVAVAKFGPADYIKDGETGLLVPEDEDQFTRALERVLTDHRLRDRLGASARQQARAYARATTAAQLESLYQRLTSPRANQRSDRARPGRELYKK